MKKIKALLLAFVLVLSFTACSENSTKGAEETERKIEKVQEEKSTVYTNIVKTVIKDYQDGNVVINDNFQEKPSEFVFPADIGVLEFYDFGAGIFQTSVKSENENTVMIVGIEEVLDEKTFEEVAVVSYVFFSEVSG